MGENGSDAVLGMYQFLNSVFATAGSYPLEGGYVYVSNYPNPLSHLPIHLILANRRQG